MRICVLDGEEIRDKEKLHEMLAEALKFPNWYGKNLDALYDCLTDGQEETEIVVRNRELLREHLGRYAELFLKVLFQAEQECAPIHLKEE